MVKLGSNPQLDLCPDATIKVELFPLGGINRVSTWTSCDRSEKYAHLILNNSTILADKGAWEIVFNENGGVIQIAAANFVANGPFQFNGNATIAPRGSIELYRTSGIPYKIDNFKNLSFGPNFVLASAETDSPAGVPMWVRTKDGKEKSIQLAGKLTFERLRIKSGTLMDASVELQCSDFQLRTFTSGTLLEFNNFGQVNVHQE